MVTVWLLTYFKMKFHNLRNDSMQACHMNMVSEGLVHIIKYVVALLH